MDRTHDLLVFKYDYVNKCFLTYEIKINFQKWNLKENDIKIQNIDYIVSTKPFIV